MFSTLFAFCCYATFSIALSGSVYKLWRAFRASSAFPRPLTPAPFTSSGMLWKLSQELLWFRSLLRADKFLWLWAWLFHLSLLFVALRHLRYFTYPVSTWVLALQPLGIWAGGLLCFSSIVLFLRRCLMPRVRYLSAPSDYVWLLLIIFIASSGLLTTFYLHTDIVQLKRFFLGLRSFESETLPQDFSIILHISGALILLILFPFSKLWHGIGLFFHPTRTQIDKLR